MRAALIDLIETAIDSVHDMDVTHRDYAEAAAEADYRARLAASLGLTDPH